jgi:hypothetical protein
MVKEGTGEEERCQPQPSVNLKIKKETHHVPAARNSIKQGHTPKEPTALLQGESALALRHY